MAIVLAGEDDRIDLAAVWGPSGQALVGHMDVDYLAHVQVVAAQLKGNGGARTRY